MEKTVMTREQIKSVLIQKEISVPEKATKEELVNLLNQSAEIADEKAKEGQTFAGEN